MSSDGLTWDGVPAGALPTAAQLAAYAGAPVTATDSLDAALAAALELVSRFVGSATVPAPVLHSAILDVASDLWHRRQHHNGIVTFDTPEGVTPWRVNRDPMASAYPILRPFVGVPLS